MKRAYIKTTEGDLSDAGGILAKTDYMPFWECSRWTGLGDTILWKKIQAGEEVELQIEACSIERNSGSGGSTLPKTASPPPPKNRKNLGAFEKFGGC